jgi:hypothetical protein
MVDGVEGALGTVRGVSLALLGTLDNLVPVLVRASSFSA